MKELILEAWNNRELLKEKKYVDAVKETIEELDKGLYFTEWAGQKK